MGFILSQKMRVDKTPQNGALDISQLHPMVP